MITKENHVEQLGGEHKGRTSSIRQVVAASYQIGAILGGGFAPLILTSLLAATGGDSWALSVYMMLAAIVTILGFYLTTEVFIEDMEDDGEPAPSRTEMREA
jgi:hypothetical protein